MNTKNSRRSKKMTKKREVRGRYRLCWTSSAFHDLRFSRHGSPVARRLAFGLGRQWVEIPPHGFVISRYFTTLVKTYNLFQVRHV